MTAAPARSSGRLLWLDPHFQIRSPAMQSMVRALPHLLSKGWQIEVWCLESDVVDTRVLVRRLRRLAWLGPLELLWFWCQVWWLRMIDRYRGVSWDIVHSSGPHVPGVDVMSLHFHNRTWFDMQTLLPAGTWKERGKRLLSAIGVVQEAVAWRSSQWRVVLPVSQGLASRVRPFLPPGRTLQVLPNALDSDRFHPGVRGRYRQEQRAEMGAEEPDFVFLFVSTGHYQRKGFWPALKALQACRQEMLESGLKVRWVVVGASAPVQARLKPDLDASCPDWASWITFVPPTAEVERWYAAADAFLFPSLYETFSLVALEASACGLPLLITPYDGHEMYLRDGINGCLLPWDSTGMKDRILRFLREERHHLIPGPAQFLTVPGYAEALDALYRSLISTHEPC